MKIEQKARVSCKTSGYWCQVDLVFPVGGVLSTNSEDSLLTVSNNKHFYDAVSIGDEVTITVEVKP